MKKLLILLSLLISVGILVGCTKDGGGSADSAGSSGNADKVAINENGFPIVDDKITISMLGQKTAIQAEWEDMSILKEYEKMTNIHIDWETPPNTDFKEKFNLLVASESYPEAFFGAAISPETQLKLGLEGIIIPLEDLIEEHAPNFKKLMDENPELRKNITAADGHIYALPRYIDNTRDLTSKKLWINKKWIDEAGLEMPKTVDDLYTVLKAFKERDPDIIPAGSSGLNDLKWGILSAFGYLGTNNLNVVDDKVIYVPTTDNYKEFLQYMNKLYNDGLLDAETFSQDEQQLYAKGEHMLLGLFSHPGAFVVVPEEESWDYVALPPLTSSINDELMWPSSSGVNQGAFAITDKNQNPEATMRWVDYFYSDEGSTFISQTGGIEDVDWEWTDETKTKWRQIVPEGENLTDVNAKRTPGTGAAIPLYVKKEWVQKEDSPLNNNIDKEVIEKYEPYFKVAFPEVHYTVDQSKELTALKTDIESYVEQMQANFVVGKASFDEWSDYIDTLNKMGLDRLIEINQEAYDVWNKN